MSVESKYFFNGGKFLEYVDFELFKDELESELNYKNNELAEFGDFYAKMIDTVPKENVNKLLFNHILYGQLKHVYIHKLNNAEGIKIGTYKRNMDKFLNLFKSPVIEAVFLDRMKPEGFNFIDQLSISKNHIYFIAALEPTIRNGVVEKVKMVLGKTYINPSKKGNISTQYMLAGVDVDFNEKLCLILIHNAAKVQKEEEDEKQISSPPSFHNFITEKLFPFLGLQSRIDVDSDREAMFNYCKSLLDTMFAESKTKIQEVMQNEIPDFVARTVTKLDEIGNKTSSAQEKDLIKNIESLMLGTYIRNNIEGRELRKKARELNLLGYPTKIIYKNSRANKSSTGSSSAQKPIHGSETLYSLYTDFGNSNKLEEWSMAWFTNINGKDLDVIRTTIYSRVNHFKVVFAPTRQLDERIIYHVIRTLNEKRNY